MCTNSKSAIVVVAVRYLTWVDSNSNVQLNGARRFNVNGCDVFRAFVITASRPRITVFFTILSHVFP